MTMKKKQYINPEMTVVALAHQGYLLTISGDVQNLSISMPLGQVPVRWKRDEG